MDFFHYVHVSLVLRALESDVVHLVNLSSAEQSERISSIDCLANAAKNNVVSLLNVKGTLLTHFQALELWC